MKRALLLLVLLSARPLVAQTAPGEIWEGYDGEWRTFRANCATVGLSDATN